MVGSKISSAVAILALMSWSAPALSAESASGMASNRMALAMPIAPEGAVPCPSNAAGDAIPCDAVAGHGSSWPTMRFLLIGIAAAGAVAVAAGTSGGGHHSAGGGTSPVSP